MSKHFNAAPVADGSSNWQVSVVETEEGHDGLVAFFYSKDALLDARLDAQLFAALKNKQLELLAINV